MKRDNNSFTRGGKQDRIKQRKHALITRAIRNKYYTVVNYGYDNYKLIDMWEAEYIIELSNSILEGKYDFSLLDEMSDDDAIKYLVQIKGVGKWTAEMIVEFTMGRLDIFSYDDVALQNGIKKAHGFKTLSKQRFERLRKKYSPYCSVASVYYYAHNDDKSEWRTTPNI